jgi:hypothetical protein
MKKKKKKLPKVRNTTLKDTNDSEMDGIPNNSKE